MYKAQREAAPDILRQQMGLVREVLDALHVHVVELAGWEADDILATVAEHAKAEGHEVIIVTGDRDSYQLVDDPGVKVLYNRRGVSDYALYDEAGIKEKTGVTPAQYTQYAALRGDPSDNLDGVPGVGEKTAAKLINTYGGLDGIFANVEAQTPKLRASLAEHEERVRSNAELMVLRRNAPIEVDLSTLHDRARRRRGPPVVRLPGVPGAHGSTVRGARHTGAAQQPSSELRGLGSGDHRRRRSGRRRIDDRRVAERSMWWPRGPATRAQRLDRPGGRD